MKNTTITVILMVTTIIFANTIHVPGDYTTIQGGIDASVNGDTVFVSSGTYVENIDFNGKSISLIGEETETTIIDGDSLDTVVKIINGENASTLLRGFTITNGNTIEQGGGIKVANYSSPTIMNCNIQYNNNNSESSGAMGAGIHCGTNSTPMIINCSINNNYGKCGGGGIGVDSNASPIFKNCNIFNNITEGSSQYHGAAVFAWGGHPTFVNCTIYENQSSGNQDGLAIINGSIATISNCTIVKHEKPTIGTWGGGSMAIILNSIIRDGSGEYIISGGLDVSYSNIDGGYEGNSNIDVDPLFTDLLNDDFTLLKESPCVDAGDPDLDDDGISWETDADDQDPDGTRMDMGAFYLHHTTFSLPEIVLLTGDTTLIPLSLDFHPDSSYSSAAITITGYQDQIEFLGIETANSLTGNAGWTYQSNESDSLGIVWTAGSTEISESGVFCYFKFYVPITTSSGIVPLSIVSAYLDEDLNYPTIINSGEISVYEIAYGDVSQNGVISPYDASLILKYLTETDSLSDQQMLNANVSLDESISALDASLILQYGVGIIESLPYDTTMGSLLAVGDIGMEDGAFTMGEIVEVPLYLTNGSNILSFETEISFDADVLIFSDIIWSDGLGEFTIESNLTDGNLLFAGAGSLPDGQNNVLATLQFTLNENFSGTETTVSMNQIRFNENEIIVNGASATLTEVLSVDDIVTPEVFALHQNYPNPFNPTTTLRYDLPEDSQVKIMIYDLMGREVKSLVNIQQNAGYKAVVWDATNNLGQPVSAGMYLYRISAGDFYSVKKMVLLK